MIRSFQCPETEAFYGGKRSKRFASIQNVLGRKLAVLAAATSLNDLRAPPGNRLEALAGDRAGQHSIRINDQFRLCFIWTPNGPESVECVDYH